MAEYSPLKHLKFPDGVPKDKVDKVMTMMKAMDDHIDKRNGEPYNWSIDDFEIGAPLGKGKFGRVYLAREKTTKYMVALKMLYKSELVQQEMQHQVVREIEIHSHLKHPNIVELLTFFSNDRNIFLVLEFAGQGELYKYLQSQPDKRFSEKISAKFIYQVSDALNYCHSHNVIHRDLKPENLLMSLKGDVLLADFGWSVHTASSKRKTICGTMYYLAPEIVSSKTYNEKVDHWCLGILCYEFLSGRPPFEGDSDRTIYERILTVDIKWPNIIKPGAKDLISKLLCLKPKDRLPLTEVMSHFWIVSNKDDK